MEKPIIIEGGNATDERGRVTFVNDFNFSGVKRLYMVENASLDVVRAFHGHMEEAKYIFVPSGRALIAAVYLDNPRSPNPKNNVEKFVLNGDKPQVLYIPKSHANGIKVLDNNTQVIVFSTSTLEESKNDDYRFPADYWGKDIWEVQK